MLYQPVKQLENVSPLVNSHILYLNSCKPNGCTVRQGNTDARTDTSDIGGGHVSAYSNSVPWANVLSCVKDVMAPFNITVTDQDPGNVPHFEVMIAGDPSDLGLPQGVGGIADYPCTNVGQCQPYLPNALVFDFASSSFYQGDLDLICGTAAQEIAHAWTLDHATANSDPMTYNPYTTPLHFRDAAPCGSDCQNGQSPFGLPCSGSTHVCTETGTASQDEVKMITAIFGPAGAAAPTVKITTPANGSTQQPGFDIQVSCTSGDGIQLVQLSIDNVAQASLTAGPYNFTAPTDLADGTHTLTVDCATNKQADATATATVTVGSKCSNDSDCQMGYICYAQACVAGMGVTGGLGDPCTKNEDCKSNSCASDGTTSACVVPCNTAMDQCPAGFGCVGTGAAGSTGGVCFPGAEKSGGGDSGGCCDAGGSNPAGPVLLSGLVGLLIVSRRRKS